MKMKKIKTKIQEIKQIRVEIRTQNNVLRELILASYPSINAFCDAHKMSATRVGELLNLKISPLNKDGKYKKISRDIAHALKRTAGMVFPLDIYGIEDPHEVFEVSFSEFQAIGGSLNALLAEQQTDPLSFLEVKEKKEAIMTVLNNKLTPLQCAVVLQEFRFDEGDEAGARERTVVLTAEFRRRIYAKAIRKLRHYNCNAELREHC